MFLSEALARVTALGGSKFRKLYLIERSNLHGQLISIFNLWILLLMCAFCHPQSGESCLPHINSYNTLLKFMGMKIRDVLIPRNLLSLSKFLSVVRIIIQSIIPINEDQLLETVQS